MNGTEISRINGSFTTAYIVTAELISQNQANNTSTIKLRGYFYYGGGTQVNSASSTFILDGTTIKTGSYSFNPGYYLLGEKTKVITHNSEGVFPTTYISSSASSFHINGSTTGQITGIPSIPRNSKLNDIANFTMGSTIPITFTKYNESYHHELHFSYIGEDDNLHTITFYDVEMIDGAYIVQLDDPEWEEIYENLPNSTSRLFEFSLVTYDDNDVQIGSASVKYATGTIPEDSTSKPVFTNFEYEDINPVTLALTGNNQKLILGHSNLRYKITTTNKMTPKKGALGNYYIFHDGLTEPYSSDSTVYHAINKINTNNLSVQAVDSRNFKSSVVQNTALAINNYTTPKINSALANRENGVDATTRLNLSASLWNGNFGAGNNIVKYFGYRTKLRTSDTWSNWYDVTAVLNSIIASKSMTVDNIEIIDEDDFYLHENGSSGGFETGKAYDVEFRISDGISTQTFNTSPNYKIEVQDGKVIRAVYKDYDGEYRIGYNGMPDENYNHTFHGTIDRDWGWIPAGETWVYDSTDDPTGIIKIDGDKTYKYSPGMRIKFTNDNNIIHGIILAVGYSSSETFITYLHEIDPSDNKALNLMQNSAITNNYYSTMKAPFGFPLDPDKWSIIKKITTNMEQSSPTQNTWYNKETITLPIGAWHLGYQAYIGGYKASSTEFRMFITLSTSSNTESDKDFTCGFNLGAGTGVLHIARGMASKNKNISIATKTNYYLNIKTDLTGVNVIEIDGANATTLIKAVCAYL